MQALTDVEKSRYDEARSTGLPHDQCMLATRDDHDWCPVCERMAEYDGDTCVTCGRQWGVDYSAEDVARRLAEEVSR